MRGRTCAGILGLFLCIACHLVAGIPAEEYIARRARVLAALDSSSAAVLKAADPRQRSNDVNFRYRQESNFFYLTGLNEPNAYLILSPKGVAIDGKTGRVIFLRESGLPGDSSMADGIVFGREKIDEVLSALARQTGTLYVSAPDCRFESDWLNGRALFLDRDSRKEFEQKHEGVKIRSVSPLLTGLREKKSFSEIALVQQAIEATGEGLRKAFGVCRPGMFEYELQAEIEYAMIKHGADYPGFPSIVGSGKNSLVPHYDENRDRLKAGDLVVMDVGAEYGGYAADITRTVPVSGRFSKAQKRVYEIVLGVQKEVIGIVKRGLPWSNLDRKVREVVGRAGLGRFLAHSVSHHLGLDVHDAGRMDTLRAGMIITVEPGIYIPSSDTTVAPSFRGIGIRIEDDILVGDHGCTVLSKDIPSAVADVERLVGRKSGG